MDYLELLSHRRSHRAFTPERVSPQDVQKLLLAANGEGAYVNVSA